MHTLQAIITGAMQGLSEFLPISSSAHIVFSNEIYELITKTTLSSNEEEIFFDIMVHLATLFAVLIYFYNDLKTISIDFFNSVKNKDYKNKNFLLGNYILLSTVITGVIGLLLKEKVEYFIQNPKYICFFLFTTGLILLFSEKFYKGNKEISLKSAVLIALAQGAAVFPGFSRSGLTISMGLFLGLNRVSAAKFSFLMSIPVIILASLIYPLISLDFAQIATFNLKAIAIGFFVSFIVGYLCIKYFMKLLGKLSLKSFAYYCLLISPLMFFVFEAFYRQ